MKGMMIGLLMALAATPAFAEAPVAATDAWVRAPAPGVPMTAGYVTLHNTTRRAIKLTAVESSRFQRIELHRSFVVDGVSRMERVPEVEIPRRGEVALEPGGLHMMMVRPIGSVRDGDMVDLVLSFDNGWSLELTVPVRRQ